MGRLVALAEVLIVIEPHKPYAPKKGNRNSPKIEGILRGYKERSLSYRMYQRLFRSSTESCISNCSWRGIRFVREPMGNGGAMRWDFLWARDDCTWNKALTDSLSNKSCNTETVSVYWKTLRYSSNALLQTALQILFLPNKFGRRSTYLPKQEQSPDYLGVE